jgi:hypothetical protein
MSSLILVVALAASTSTASPSVSRTSSASLGAVHSVATAVLAPPDAERRRARADAAVATPLAGATGLARWKDGEARAFVGATVDVGYLYLRPRFQLGFGRPHWSWGGVELSPIVSLNGFGGYAGLRGALPSVDLRVGARGFASFERAFLEARPRHERISLASTASAPARYVTLEAELNGHLRLGPGELLATTSLSAVLGAPGGAHVYEETLMVITAPPWIARGRLAYAWFPFSGAHHSIAAVVDVLALPARGAAVVRVGVVLRVLMTPSLEVRGTFVPSVAGPDAIGVLAGDFTELGVRYRWASE